MDPLSEAKTIEADIINYRRHLHRHPEASTREFETASFIAAELKKMGLAPRQYLGGCAVAADIKAPAAKKTLALRADTDALPIEEQNDVPYKSLSVGLMHACGHDGHVAMLLGAARLLTKFADDITSNIRLIFQPSEELPPGGALPLIGESVLEGVDQIFGLHIDTSMDVGEMASGPGPMMANMDKFKIVITGKGGHASEPHLAVDPILPAAEIILALPSIVGKDIPAAEKTVVCVGSFRAGTRYNVIPDSAQFEGTVRTLADAPRRLIEKRIKEIVEGICMAHKTGFHIDYQLGYPALINNPDVFNKAKNIAVGLGFAFRELEPRMFGEDFSYYLQKIPGCFMFIGGRSEPKGLARIPHSSTFDFDEELLHKGSAFFLALALS